ncbi:MAG: T9SS type A sorting domain-containing protein [Bacteroidota bacterium]
MKKLILILLTAISIQATSQEFAPIGAKWHYDQGTFNPDLTTYQTFESISDTVINGISCRKLMKISRMAGTEMSWLYMYSVNDSVFFYSGNSFHLLYDFGAMTGDTVTVGYYTTYDGSPLKMSIDSTSTIIINGETRKLQYVSCGDGMVIEFGGIVIEGIGNVTYMFPRHDLSLDGPLRCYEDSNIGLFINPYHSDNGWNFQDCEQVLTGIADKGKTADITIYPNPASRFLEIANLDRPTEFTFINIQGKVIKSGIVKPSQLINLNDLSRGLYFLKLQNSNLLTTRKIIKK